MGTIETSKLDKVTPLRILTAKGGPYALTAPLRDMVCLLENGSLYLSTSHQTNHYVLGFLERLARHNVHFHLKPTSLSEIQKLYKTLPTSQAISSEAKHAQPQAITIPVQTEQTSTQRQAEVVKLIGEAVKAGASDVHLIVAEQNCQVRWRIHGELKTVCELTAQHGHDLCATIYQSMCDVADPIYHPGKNQDARLKRSFLKEYGLFGVRIATAPIECGTLMVLRLLYDHHNAKPTLDALGYLPEQVSLLRRISQRITGINIFSGATGSGKSTTLECVLTDLLRSLEQKIHLLTIEDPPEYTITGANQIPILCDKDDEAVLSSEWSRAISNSLRLDPDVIMIGEMRDAASALSAFRAAMTGHGVWTTLHANDVVSILERLSDLGIEMSLLTDPLLVTGLINQSLVRKLCLHCRKPYLKHKHTLAEDIVQRIERTCLPEQIQLQGDGCKHCHQTGIAGRLVVAEVLMPTQRLMNVFKAEGKAQARAFWMQQMGGITKNQHLIRRINEGLVDPQLGERDVGLLDTDYLIERD